MGTVRKRGKQVRQFILMNLEAHGSDIASLTRKEFGITRQAVSKHIKRLIEYKAIRIQGAGRKRIYKLCPLVEQTNDYDVSHPLAEDVIWDSDIQPLVADLPDSVRDIWVYGFTEMFNNAVDHSSGKKITTLFKRTAITTEIVISDDGEGIFRKIQRELNLHDERHAALELAKGKLTTDPSGYSGQGIFFTSRMFDEFAILSGDVYFSHALNEVEDWIHQSQSLGSSTAVFMKLNNNTQRTTSQVLDAFSSGDDYAFTKTIVPVRLAQSGDEKLVSRSHAKRLLTSVDKYKIVIFDFSGVEVVGQAFADEVFRVFKEQHPEIEIAALNAAEEVSQMIRRAQSPANAD